MNKLLQLFILLILAGTFYTTVLAQDSDNGEALVEKSCQGCHDNSMYTRTNSIIFSLSALEKRVRFCESMAGARWSEDEMQAAIQYLNKAFYHFKK